MNGSKSFPDYEEGVLSLSPPFQGHELPPAAATTGDRGLRCHLDTV